MCCPKGRFGDLRFSDHWRGIAGASAAHELAPYGKVLLLEKEDAPGFHATGRSAALFTRNYGNSVVRQVNIASAAFFRVPPDGFCETPLLTPRGCLTVAQGVTHARLTPCWAFRNRERKFPA
ncbi:FAD-dependent oxidoreductase [Sulfitobacter aestuariivivens]|uniref:FAD-dependent oxidoreductase n=1 Tax=Sulfitobacter aestuariivivens TaxID=2766981 RepID=UPI0036209201